MKFLITFISSGGLVVEAENEAEVRQKFDHDAELKAEVIARLKEEGIELCDVEEFEES